MVQRLRWMLLRPLWAAAQNGAPQFEAAVIKVHHGPTAKSISPGQYELIGISLKRLLVGAYGVTQYQLAGPDWMASEAYDVIAKLPPGATNAQIRLMLQSLLTERFQLKMHHEGRVMNVDVLTLGRGGIKMQAAPPDAKPDSLRKSVARNGRVTLTAENCSLGRLAEALSEELGEPVKDQTGTAGLFAFSLEFARSGSTDPEAGTPLPAALSGQLGLRLESRKGPMDVLVIDHAEKVPVEK